MAPTTTITEQQQVIGIYGRAYGLVGGLSLPETGIVNNEITLKIPSVPVGINEWLESHNIHNHWKQTSYYYSTRVESDGVGWSGADIPIL